MKKVLALYNPSKSFDELVKRIETKKSDNYGVQIATSIEEAHEFLKTNKYDIFLVDTVTFGFGYDRVGQTKGVTHLERIAQDTGKDMSFTDKGIANTLTYLEYLREKEGMNQQVPIHIIDLEGVLKTSENYSQQDFYMLPHTRVHTNYMPRKKEPNQEISDLAA